MGPSPSAIDGGCFQEFYCINPRAYHASPKEPVIRVREAALKFDYRGIRTKYVRVFGYPADGSPATLIAELETFGKVRDKSMEFVPGFDDVPSGTLKLRMEMARAVAQ